MDKIIINGFEFNDFGSNNYSEGAHLVTCAKSPICNVGGFAQLSEEIWFALNPSAPANNMECFGFLGTLKEVTEAQNTQHEACYAKMEISYFESFNHFLTATPEEHAAAKNYVRENYKDWWLK